MVKSYRSKSQLMYEILKVIDGEKDLTKTKIMFQAYLSHSQLKRYLILLTNNKLIRTNQEKDKYNLTDKGRRFITLSKELNELS